MLTTVEAVLGADGSLAFAEPVHLDRPQRVLVTFTEPLGDSMNGAALSETALAADWLDAAEDAAWAHLQAPPAPGVTGSPR